MSAAVAEGGIGRGGSGHILKCSVILSLSGSQNHSVLQDEKILETRGDTSCTVTS